MGWMTINLLAKATPWLCHCACSWIKLLPPLARNWHFALHQTNKPKIYLCYYTQCKNAKVDLSSLLNSSSEKINLKNYNNSLFKSLSDRVHQHTAFIKNTLKSCVRHKNVNTYVDKNDFFFYQCLTLLCANCTFYNGINCVFHIFRLLA